MPTDVVCPTCNTVSHLDDVDAARAVFVARATTPFSGPTRLPSPRRRREIPSASGCAGCLAPKDGPSCKR